MRRPLQFGMRQNPASNRRHGSRTVVATCSNAISVEEESPESGPPSVQNDMPTTDHEKLLHAALTSAATGGEKGNESHLLNVREVAELLSVPVSWVYGRMRKRSLERIPAYRIGKYWRFKADEVMSWLHETARHSGPEQKV